MGHRFVEQSPTMGGVALGEMYQRLTWSDEPNGVVLTCGVPLQPAGIDPRYPALARMSAELDQLTDHCHRRRDERAAPVSDPAIGSADVRAAVSMGTKRASRVQVSTTVRTSAAPVSGVSHDTTVPSSQVR